MLFIPAPVRIFIICKLRRSRHHTWGKWSLDACSRKRYNWLIKAWPELFARMFSWFLKSILLWQIYTSNLHKNRIENNPNTCVLIWFLVYKFVRTTWFGFDSQMVPPVNIFGIIMLRDTWGHHTQRLWLEWPKICWLFEFFFCFFLSHFRAIMAPTTMERAVSTTLLSTQQQQDITSLTTSTSTSDILFDHIKNEETTNNGRFRTTQGYHMGRRSVITDAVTRSLFGC